MLVSLAAKNRMAVAVLLFIGFILTAGCVRFVADYDAAVFEEIISLSRSVDQFHGELLEAPSGKEGYAYFKDSYRG